MNRIALSDGLPFKSIVIRILQLLLVTMLFWPYAPGPLIGDDLTLVVSAIHAQQTGESLQHYSWSLITQSITANHVLPLGGLVTAIVTWPIAWLGSLGSSLPLLWSGFRVGMIILTLFVTAWSATEWIAVGAERKIKSQVRWSLFLFAAAAAGALVQVHGYWSQDPILAYGIAAWISPIVIFGFLGGIRRVYALRTWFSRWALICLILAVIGIFIYELTIVGVLAALLLPPILLLFRVQRISGRGLIVGSVISIISLVIFVAVQWLRLLSPGSYGGTTPGYAQMALPVWFTSMLGNLPFTNTFLTLEYGLELNPSLVQLVALPVIVMVLWVTAQKLQQGVRTQVSLRAMFVFLGLLVVVTSLATAVFALTAKYQMEIGGQIGKVYLFYAFGLIWVAFSFALLVFVLGSGSARRRLVSTAIGMTLALASVVQFTINSASLQVINDDWAWTQLYVSTLQRVDMEGDWCGLSDSLAKSEIPSACQDQIRRQTKETLTVQRRDFVCPS